MEEIISQVPLWIQAAALVLSSLTVIATVVVRFTPSTKDDEQVAAFKKFLDKVLLWLPTIGINPKTKELQKKTEEKK